MKQNFGFDFAYFVVLSVLHIKAYLSKKYLPIFEN